MFSYPPITVAILQSAMASEQEIDNFLEFYGESQALPLNDDEIIKHYQHFNWTNLATSLLDGDGFCDYTNIVHPKLKELDRIAAKSDFYEEFGYYSPECIKFVNENKPNILCKYQKLACLTFARLYRQLMLKEVASE